MALGRQAERRQRLRTVIVIGRLGAGIVGQPGVGHVLPQEVLEGTDLFRDDRVLGQDGQTVLAGEEAETIGVIGRAGLTVAIEVEPRGDTGVGFGGIGIGVAALSRCPFFKLIA